MRSKGQAPDLVRQADEAVDIYLQFVRARFNGPAGSFLEDKGGTLPIQ
ncbi:hypothetical protein [Desulfogranum japonicum]|nr:hypothetical protein [Desulfogranum japonicum]